jgi:hypothetical protein
MGQMTVVHLGEAGLVLSSALLFFAFLTWRRALAQRALVAGVASVLFLLMLEGASPLWRLAGVVFLCAAVLISLIPFGLRSRRGAGYQKGPGGHQQSTSSLGPRSFGLTELN